MHYVTQFDINGVASRQAACIELHGKPNAATEGFVGVLGVDLDSPTHDVYKCVAVNGSIYTWELLSSGMSVIVATTSASGASSTSFSYSMLRIPRDYVVKVGDTILDSEGYLYQVTAINETYCEANYTGTKLASGGAASHNTVANYGAMGDGVTDDTAAFAAALAAERVVIVPGGTYKLSSGLVVRENCMLELEQDAVLNFTNTSGNCITLLRLANLKGNHATINVPYAFTGNVINCDTGDDQAALDPNNLKDSNAAAVPPFTKWSPQWKMSRYMTDINICKPKSDGEHNSTDGSSSGTAVYLHCNAEDFVSFMWGVNMSGIRIAGAFNYGIRAYNIGAHVESWNHDMRIEAVVDACKVGVSLENCYYARLEVSVQARAAANGVVYATHGVELRDSRGVDMSGSRVWDWNGSNSLWASGNQYQHIGLYGECRGLILDDFMYYENSTDLRELIYTNKASNFEQMTVLQEPVTRWFKPKDGEPVFFDGLAEKKLITEEQMNALFGTALVKGFTDVLATATDENGNVLDGKGYTGGYLTGTGALYTGGDSKAYYVTTGFIPCAKGQTAYVEGMSYASYDGSCTLCMYDANRKFISTVSAANLVKGNYWYASYSATANGFSVMPTAVVGNENVKYIRFTVLKSQTGENPMIAIDEEIKYTVEGVLADGIKVKGENVIGGTSGGGSFCVNISAVNGYSCTTKVSALEAILDTGCSIVAKITTDTGALFASLCSYETMANNSYGRIVMFALGILTFTLTPTASGSYAVAVSGD